MASDRLTRRLLFSVVLWFVVASQTAVRVRADVVMLKSGGRLEGAIQQRPSNQSDYYVLRIGAGTHIRIPSKDVGRVEEMSAVEQRYVQLLPDMPDTEKGHFALADWCHENGLRDQRTFHLEYVLRHNPDHAEARKMLGYSFVRGQWVRSDEFMESQGYQQHRGTWRLPQQVALANRKRDLETAQKKWRADIRRWRGWLNGRQRQVAEQKLRAINDPVAAAGLKELAAKERDPDVRKIYVDVLSKLKSPDAMTALIDRAMHDDELEVRVKAIESLRGSGSVTPFIRALRSPDNGDVKRAGVALGRLGDENAVRPLIDALVTTHSYVVKPAANIQTGFGGTRDGSTGLNGFSAGGGPKKVSRDIQNKSVLDALVSITGQNYRYSKSDWNRWYIREHSLPDSIDLRRD